MTIEILLILFDLVSDRVLSIPIITFLNLFTPETCYTNDKYHRITEYKIYFFEYF